MKKFKIMLVILGTVLSVSLGIFIYFNALDFEISRELIYQYNMGIEIPREFMSIYRIDDFIDELDDKGVKDDLTTIVKGIDRNEYKFLVIRGGELKSFKMKKNKKYSYPHRTYKKGVPRDTVSIYLIKNNRFIERDQ